MWSIEAEGEQPLPFPKTHVKPDLIWYTLHRIGTTR